MTIKTRKAAAPETNTPTTGHPKRKILTRARSKSAADQVAALATASALDDASDVVSPQAAAPVAQGVQAVGLEGLEHPVTGRGVFAVRTLGTAVSVEAAFLAEDGQVLRLPVVFPNREYAQSQLKELWQLVNRYFDELDNAARDAVNPV